MEKQKILIPARKERKKTLDIVRRRRPKKRRQFEKLEEIERKIRKSPRGKERKRGVLVGKKKAIHRGERKKEREARMHLLKKSGKECVLERGGKKTEKCPRSI